MNVRVITWNIGGGKLLREKGDSKDRLQYTDNGLDYITDVLLRERPDIITLQEVHIADTYSQPAEIAKKLGYFYAEHIVDDSHIEDGMKLGNAVLSRFPIVDSTTGFFLNLHLPITLEDGRTQSMHNKGHVTSTVQIGSVRCAVSSLHLMPFRRYAIAVPSGVADEVLKTVVDALAPTEEHVLIGGDFNIDEGTVGHYLEPLGLSEIELTGPTTPKGRRYDRVLFKGFRLNHVAIDSTIKPITIR